MYRVTATVVVVQVIGRLDVPTSPISGPVLSMLCYERRKHGIRAFENRTTDAVFCRAMLINPPSPHPSRYFDRSCIIVSLPPPH